MSWTPVEPRPAAAILLVTEDGRVLIGERAGVTFLAGFLSFPGGGVEAGDHLGSGELAPSRGAALRELAEETGVLLARGGRLLAAGDGPLSAQYDALGVEPPAPEELIFAGRWITPEASPIRFDTRFFLATARVLIEPSPRSELRWARFLTPAEVLAAWSRSEVLLSPPTKHALDVLALGTSSTETARRLIAVPEALGEMSIELEPVPGIRMLALRTPTLPPARHTNAYIIGEERLVIVDPATYEREEREKLLDRIELRTNAGATVEAIVLTHHHADHVGAAAWLAQQIHAPIAAHPITRDLLAGDPKVDRLLVEGDIIDLGGGFELDVLHTPGHAPGHIVLADRRPGARGLIAGDMVASIGTIIVDPPEGDMATYIDQLRRLRARPNAILYPAHGGPIVDGHAKLDEYVAHRLKREAKVLDALRRAGKPSRPTELLDHAYDDTPPALYPLAARSCLAHLEKLVKDGRAARAGDRFSPAPRGP